MKEESKIIQRRYEERHKAERKAAHAVWGTSMSRTDFEKLNDFLKMHNFRKIELIYAGWGALQKQIAEKDSLKK